MNQFEALEFVMQLSKLANETLYRRFAEAQCEEECRSVMSDFESKCRKVHELMQFIQDN